LTPVEPLSDSPELRLLGGDAFLKWFDIVRSWLAAWTGAPVREVGTQYESVIHIPTKDGHMAGSGGRLGMVFVEGVQPASAKQVRGAFARASRRQQLPVEHKLLLEAWIALLEGDHRRAVIDAGTATEVALATAISGQLLRSRVPPNLVDEVIKQANGIAGLATLYLRAGQPLPVSKNRIMSELANTRNEAAHGGRSPSADECVAAVGHARSLVWSAQPLPAY
jgi:hypothetical protein